jgi:DNA polymerase-3 subunit beta
LARASILSNEKYRAIRLNLEKGVLRILANNPDQEEAEDELEIDYDGEAIEIGFNVSYLIEALAVLPSDIARVHFSDASSSCLIRGGDREDCQYVVMPMRL